MKESLASVLFLCLLLFCCDNVDTDYVLQARPVVEAYLSPNKEIEVLITREILFSDTDTTHYLNGLEVTITQGDITYSLANTGNGIYKSRGHLAKTGREYAIHFSYLGMEIRATTSIPEKPKAFSSSANVYTVQSFTPTPGVMPTFPDPLELSWTNSDHDYYLVVVQNMEDDPEQINANTNRPPFLFRNDPNQGASYQLRPQQFQYYGTHYLILYRLTPEYAAMYQNNGNSSLTIKTPYTNVTNGLGIFAGVNADTLTLEVRKP